MKVFVVGGRSFYDYMNWIPDAEPTEDLASAELVLFAGGEDVDPEMYSEPRGKYTSSNINRDIKEVKLLGKALELKKPLLGICRGSQFLCAMAGGRLVQHQEQNMYCHFIQTFDNKELIITSTHHQAQFPYNLNEGEFKVLGWTENLSKFHLDGEDKEISDKPFKEVEIAYYPTINALAIQGHPEHLIMKNHPSTIFWLQGLVRNLLTNKL